MVLPRQQGRRSRAALRNMATAGAGPSLAAAFRRPRKASRPANQSGANSAGPSSKRLLQFVWIGPRELGKPPMPSSVEGRRQVSDEPALLASGDSLQLAAQRPPIGFQLPAGSAQLSSASSTLVWSGASS